MTDGSAQGGTKQDNGGGGKDDSGPPPPAATIREAFIRLLHPISLTILVILVGVTLLIAANVLGWDSGNVLTRMSTHEFARGLITYLFAVTTIGTSVVLVMAALMREISEEAYTRGKEILALLLGVFGTIVGFYFGSETGAAKVEQTLSISEPLVSASTVRGGESVRVTALATGGSPPYSYGIGTGEASAVTTDRPVGSNGWIVTDYTAPRVIETSELVIVLVVRDSTGATSSTRSTVLVVPAPATVAPTPP